MSDIEVIDNFLSKTDHDNLTAELLGVEFPWYYQGTKIAGIDSMALVEPSQRAIDMGYGFHDFQFTHQVYREHSWQSNFGDIFASLLVKIAPVAWIRIKANMTLQAQEVATIGFHNDHPSDLVKASIYYLNSTDGGTIFQSGDRVECVANRLVTFNANEMHSAETFTNARVRCVVNMNYI
jgi:hypothetical protein